MASKYVDITAIMQVIGCVYNNPRILDMDDRYSITEEDFPDEFHRIVFGSIYKIYELGANKVTLENIADFLSSRPKKEAVYKLNKGEEWLLKISETATTSSFDYYYQRLKKFSLLRAYDNYGFNVSFIYDPDNILDSEKKQLQEDKLDNSSLDQIAHLIDEKIEEIKVKYVDEVDNEAYQAGEELDALIDRFKEQPEVGIPMYGPLMNTITRGARLKKLYLRSAATGVGKSRSMVADACTFACNKIYDDNFGWIKNGECEPTLYITTEQELEEVQTMMLAFLSNVNEDHILNGSYEPGEEERVRQAAAILRESPLYIVEMPDFSLQDVESIIKQNIREKNIHYICLDYLHTSLKILEEITRRSGGVKLREDNILFMFAIRLKDICNEYGVFILTSTQLNADYQTAETPDQNLLRGAKSIADKIDWGAIMLGVKDEDLVALENVFQAGMFNKPNIKISIYKNRRGRYKGIYLWCDANLGTCRVRPMFATNYNYELINIDDTRVIVEDSAF